ncbi:MAG: hypothetical protein KDK33_14910 [Leptospiraceae bacterium]|nr:hypothetical protein [Leptospiraceae bacterium]
MAQKKNQGGRKRVIKFMIHGDQVTYTGFLLLDMDRSNVVEWGGNAGSGSAYSSVPLDLPWKEFGSWLRTREFQGQIDPGPTTDIQRFIQSRSSNMVTADRMIQLLNDNNLETLRYEWERDLEVSLGIHDPELELVITDLDAEVKKSEETQVAQSGMALQFIISPFQGTPLFRLQIDQRVHVRFKDVKNVSVQNYLKSQSIEIKENRAEAVGRIVSMKSLPESRETLIKIQLPGGGEGYIQEENPNIKVRTFVPSAEKKDASAMGGFYAGASREISLMQFAIFGGLLFGLLLLGSLIWALM